MRLVADQLEVVEAEGEEVLHGRIELQGRQGERGALELQVGLLLVVHVEVRVAQGVHEVAWREARGLRHHHGGEVRSEEHTSELQSLLRRSYAVFCLQKKNNELLQMLTDSTRPTMLTIQPH